MSRVILRNIKLNTEQLCNNKDTTVLLIAIREGVEYQDGKPTGNISHYKYDTVLPYNAYEKLTVKIAGVPLITQEQIDQKGGTVKVKFRNLVGAVYMKSNGEFAISASADGMEVVG